MRSAVVLDIHAVLVPALGELPELRHRQRPAAGGLFGSQPGIQILFRPEEKYGRSGGNQVIVPARKRD